MNSKLKDISFNYDIILKVIQSLDPNKPHGNDGVAEIRLHLSCSSIIKPLLIIFYNYLEFGTFADDWKEGNISPVHRNIVNKL